MSLLNARQMALFANAVRRRSHGAVELPPCTVPRAEARHAWAMVLSAFPKVQACRGETPGEFEMARFTRFVARTSKGLIKVSPVAGLDREAMFAMTRLATRLAGWLDRYPERGAPPTWIASAGILVAATQLAACSTLLGGNVKGNFACAAPGGSCAPSTVIDDQALSAIQNARPMTPAGPYYSPPDSARPVTASNRGSSRARAALVAENGMIHRDRRVLRVVFPSFVDGRGNVHEPRVVNTVVDSGGWMQLSGGDLNAGERAVGAAAAGNLASPAATTERVSAREAGAMTPIDLQGWALDSGGSRGAGVAAAPGAPEASAIDAARRRGPPLAADPLQDIRARVQARLSGVSGLPAGSTQAPPKAPVPTGSALPPSSEPPGSVGAVPTAAPGSAPANAPSSFPSKIEE